VYSVYSYTYILIGAVVSHYLSRTESVSAAGVVLWLSKSDNESSLINYVVRRTEVSSMLQRKNVVVAACFDRGTRGSLGKAQPAPLQRPVAIASFGPPSFLLLIAPSLHLIHRFLL